MSPQRKPPTAPKKREHSQLLERTFEIGFIRQFVKPSSTVLDVGCGTEAALATVLAEFPKRTPHSYIGLDNRVRNEYRFTWAELYDVDPFVGIRERDDQFSIVVASDLLERLSSKTKRGPTIQAVANRLEPSGTAFVGVSFSGRFRVDSFENDVRSAGLVIDDRFGVRAELGELRRELPTEAKRIARKLERYFDPAIVAAFLAATEPDAATRIIYVLRHEGADKVDTRPPSRNLPSKAGTKARLAKEAENKKKQRTPQPSAKTGKVSRKAAKKAVKKTAKGNLDG